MSHANKLFQTDVLLALSIPATVAGQAPPQTTRCVRQEVLLETLRRSQKNQNSLKLPSSVMKKIRKMTAPRQSRCRGITTGEGS
jgi:hypothetical protein